MDVEKARQHVAHHATKINYAVEVDDPIALKASIQNYAKSTAQLIQFAHGECYYFFLFFFLSIMVYLLK